MSRAFLDTKWTTRSTLCAGQRSPPVHRTTAVSSVSSSNKASSSDFFADFFLDDEARTTRVTLDPHAGHRSGGWTGADDVYDSYSNPAIRGMTSPARSTTTLAPTPNFFLATSSKLCNVARATVAPPSSTGGSSSATGVSAPVRPTCTSTPTSVVTAVSAGNLCATAHLGALLSEPNSLCNPKSSTLYTTPSMRYPKLVLPRAVARDACAATTSSRDSLTRNTGTGASPNAGSHSRNSDCELQPAPTTSPCP
mmetsp:Transcript_4228/g.19170  ORF Transcript_4228/g.19170 Transcript_4228/m.19170 type:complete len:252 (-) Transcript_4228:984-1739(-)